MYQIWNVEFSYLEVKDNQARFEEGSEEEDHGVLRSLPSAFKYVIHLVKNTHSQGVDMQYTYDWTFLNFLQHSSHRWLCLLRLFLQQDCTLLMGLGWHGGNPDNKAFYWLVWLFVFFRIGGKRRNCTLFCQTMVQTFMAETSGEFWHLSFILDIHHYLLLDIVKTFFYKRSKRRHLRWM